MKRLSAFLIIGIVAFLAACSGPSNGGAENALPQAPVTSAPQSALPMASMQPDATIATTATPTPMPSVITKSGGVVGVDNGFSPNDGDTSAGGQGQTIDGIPCSTTMYGSGTQYHVHAFVGLLVNGKEIAIPDAIGLYQPGAETNGFTATAQCYYSVHTHDAGGYIHLEANSTAWNGTSLYTLGNFLDIWGEPISATAFGPFKGTVTVFYATTPLGNLYSGNYVQYTGTAPKSIKLWSHEAIWIEVGTLVPASQLPKVRFYTEY